MISTEKYLKTYIENRRDVLINELKEFKKVNDIKFDLPHTIDVVSSVEWQDSGDNQNSCTGKILKIKVGRFEFLVYQSWSDYSCDFDLTTSLRQVIDILD